MWNDEEGCALKRKLALVRDTGRDLQCRAKSREFILAYYYFAREY